MPIRDVSIDERAKTVTIVLDLEPKKSANGGMMKIASTRRAFDKTNAGYDGNEVIASVTVGYKL